MAGIMAVGELGHAMESLLEAVVEHRSELGRDGIPLLERGFDRLHAMVTRVGERRAIAMPEALIAAIRRARQGPHATNRRAGDRHAPTHAAPKVELKPLSAPIVDAPTGDDDDIGVRAPQEQVRIRADLLDRLVNYAGEVAIYRSRLEQQLGAFRGAMGEMEQTNARLRDQLRRLDIETEAQIIARYQREHDTADHTFDPLELDRFSNLQQLSRGLAESAADLSVAAGLAGRPDAPVRNPAAAAVARELGTAGRPHAHAHGAVRRARAAPAPRRPPGGGRHRQAACSSSSTARRANSTATCSSA